MNGLDAFKRSLADHLSGKTAVAVSVCSSHPIVLQALFRAALHYDTFALIETTPAQVNLTGGYSRLTPEKFVSSVYQIANVERFPYHRILFGADHLGPSHWCELASDEAMQEAKRLAAEYLRAGYQKIHIDTSLPCRDEPLPLPLSLIAERSAELVAYCEEERKSDRVVYILGSEVPVPGGGERKAVSSTSESLDATINQLLQAFENRKMAGVWKRVVALVVEAGVTFSGDRIQEFNPLPDLAHAISRYPGLVFEAHSTDFQMPDTLNRMVENRFFILKVGPWLTHNLKESLFLLELMERDLGCKPASRFKNTLEKAMLKNPIHWKNYYSGNEKAVLYQISHSYLDRSRYYMALPEVVSAKKRLLRNLGSGIPETLVSQYMPNQYFKVRSRRLSQGPMDLMIDRICDVLAYYMEAGVRPSGKADWAMSVE